MEDCQHREWGDNRVRMGQGRNMGNQMLQECAGNPTIYCELHV